MADSERESYVALLDILGFKHMVANDNLKDLALTLKSLPKNRYPGVKSIQFSDSVLLYTEGATPNHLRKIVGQTTQLILDSLHRGIGLRAGITRGKFLRHRGVFLGPAMVRAYELEQMQEWIGGIVDPELDNDQQLAPAFEDLEWLGLLVRYEAPIKGGSVGLLRCLAWPTVEKDCPVVRTRGDEPKSWDVMRKIANTNRFRDFAIEHSRN